MKFLFLILFFSNYSYAAPLSLRQTQDMSFGTLVQGDPAKTIVAGASEPNNARFQVKGTKNTSYSIIIPSTIILNNLSNSSYTLTISSLSSSPSGTGVLDSKGRDTLYIGGTLDAIPSSSLSGGYEGSFTIDVVY